MDLCTGYYGSRERSKLDCGEGGNSMKISQRG